MGGSQSREKLLILHIFEQQMVFFRTMTVPQEKSVRFTSMKLIISIILCFNSIIPMTCFQINRITPKTNTFTEKQGGNSGIQYKVLYHGFYRSDFLK